MIEPTLACIRPVAAFSTFVAIFPWGFSDLKLRLDFWPTLRFASDRIIMDTSTSVLEKLLFRYRVIEGDVEIGFGLI